MNTSTLGSPKRSLKFLLSARDGGPADIWKSLEQPLLDRGHTFVFDLEGVAASKFPERPKLALEPDQKIDQAQAEEILRFNRIDGVLLTPDSPINRNLQYAKAARKLGVPSISVVDVDGALTRFEDNAVSLALERSNSSLEIDHKTGRFEKAVIIGHPMSARVDQIVANPNLGLSLEVQRLTKDRELKLIMVCGQGPRTTTDMLQVLLASLQKTPQKVVVYVRLHPSKAKCPRTPELRAAMGDLVETGIPLATFTGFSAEEIGAFVDAGWGAYSTVADWLISMGKNMFMVSTRAIREDFSGETNLDTFHLWPDGINSNMAVGVPDDGIDLSPWLGRPNEHAGLMKEILRWKPDEAVRAIEDVCD